MSLGLFISYVIFYPTIILSAHTSYVRYSATHWREQILFITYYLLFEKDLLE